MIKIDVEGYEPEVFKGAQVLLSDSRLSVIETETFTPEMATMLDSLGFKQMQYEPFSRILRQSDEKGAASNFLLVRNCKFVRDRLASANQVSIFNVSF